MQNQPASAPARSNRPRIRLPFEKRPGDPGTWSYDHRAGICITLIFFMLVAIAFLWWKIDLGADGAQGMIMVEFPEEMIESPEDFPDPDMPHIEDFSNVRNLASNEAMDLNSELRDDRGTDASKLYENAFSVDERMQANREAYEAGLLEQQHSAGQPTQGTEEGTERSTARVQGTVTVSYIFSNPTRHDVALVTPAYQCERGGQVVINAILDINGNVTSASVDKGKSSPDDCMQSTALSAARRSKFNLDPSAPSRHRGTITYLFVPQ